MTYPGYPNLVHGFNQLIGARPGWAGPLAGPALGAVGRTAVGAGLGYGLGTIAASFAKNDKARIRRNWAVGGALASVPFTALDVQASAASGHGPANWQTENPMALNKPIDLQKMAAAGWVGAYVEGPLKQDILTQVRRIDDSDVDPEEGRDFHPHVTGIYGLHEKVTPKDIENKLKTLGPLSFQLGNASLFTGNPKYDVLKLDIAGHSIRRWNSKLQELPHSSSHKHYKPHLTLAFLKKGKGHKYTGKTTLTGRNYLATRVTHSNAYKDRTDIPLDRQRRDREGKFAKKAEAPMFEMPDAVTRSKIAMMTFGGFASNPTGSEAGGHVSIDTAADSILADPSMDPVQKSIAFRILADAADNHPHGLVTAGALTRGAVQAGLGYAGGAVVGKMMSALFGMPAQTQRRLAQAGGVGGFLNGVL